MGTKDGALSRWNNYRELGIASKGWLQNLKSGVICLYREASAALIDSKDWLQNQKSGEKAA